MINKTHSNHTRLRELARTIEGTTQSFDGTSIWFKSTGQGLPVVCCNGIGCSTFYFNYLEDYFKQTHQIITWDYRGHGKSGDPGLREKHTIETLVLDMKAVVDALKLKKAILVGHSMGTQIIYEFYARWPQKCVALIPCFGTFEKPMDTFFNSPLSKYFFEIIYMVNQVFPWLSKIVGTLAAKNPFWFQLGGILKMLKPYLADKSILEQYVNHIINVDPIFFSNLVKDWQNHTSIESLKKIKIPTLIFGAEEDQFTPVWISKKIHHLIPHSELFIIKKGTHVALIEQPELINLRIEKFLSENGIYTYHKKRSSRPLKITPKINKIPLQVAG